MSEKVFQIMVDEYREACRNCYETRYGCKLNTKYRIKNENTGEVINGSASGCCHDKESRGAMRTIRRMMIAIYGNQVEETLDEIRKEERIKERDFFKENPQFVVYVTDIE